MNTPPIILKSDKRTALLNDDSKLEARIAQTAAEHRRLNKILHPDLDDATVRRYDTTRENMKNAVISTAPNADRERAARQAENIKRTLAGESPAQSSDIKAQRAVVREQWSALEYARDFISRELKKEDDVLGAEYCKLKLPEHDEKMRRLFKALLEVHAVHSELSELRRQFVDSGIPTWGILQLMPNIDEVLGNSKNSHSSFADLLRAGKQAGYIVKLPPEFQLV
jgi:hypothetical protein